MDNIYCKKIFIVDDDEEIIFLIKSILEKGGFNNISTFKNSTDGFKQILFERPDLLFLDIILPDSNGINLGQAIDTIYDQGLPTIFMSSEKSYAKVIATHNFKKPTIFLSKPINSDTIINNTTSILKEIAEYKDKLPELERFTKPWPVLFIAILLFFEPLIKMIYFFITKDMDFATIFSNVIRIDTPKAFFEFWLLFPLSGILLFNIKKWAYYSFLLLQAYSIWMHLNYISFTWPFSAAFPHLSSLILLFLNIGVIIYFLIPAIRRPYFDQNLRPWEAGPEYYIDVTCNLLNNSNGEITQANLVKISKSKATLSLDKELPISTEVMINFSFYNFYFSLSGKISEHIKHENTILFHHVNFNMIQYGDKINFRKFLKALSIVQKI